MSHANHIPLEQDPISLREANTLYTIVRGLSAVSRTDYIRSGLSETLMVTSIKAIRLNGCCWTKEYSHSAPARAAL